MKCKHGNSITFCGLGCASNPCINPIAWDKKRDQFVMAALTGAMSLSYDTKTEMFGALGSHEIAVTFGVAAIEQLYGARPPEVE